MPCLFKCFFTSNNYIFALKAESRQLHGISGHYSIDLKASKCVYDIPRSSLFLLIVQITKFELSRIKIF